MTTTVAKVIKKRLKELAKFLLGTGSHPPDDGKCAMEMVAYIAGEPHSDKPACACRVITGYVISLNDNWTDADRQRLKPYLERIVGTRSTLEVETRRAIAALDWTMRVHRPLWLDAAGLSEQAAALRALPAIVDESTFQAAQAAQERAIAAARAARAAWDAWDARAAWAARAARAAWAARAARAARAAWDAWAAWDARAAWAARAARAAWAAWDAWDAIPCLIASRAGGALGDGASETQRRDPGIAALDEVAAKVRDAELDLLDRMIGITDPANTAPAR